MNIINNGLGIFPNINNGKFVGGSGIFNPNLIETITYVAADHEFEGIVDTSFEDEGIDQINIIVRCQIQTSGDINTGQVIWESGGGATGCGLGLQSGLLKVYGGSDITEYANTYSLSTNTTYDIAVVYDLTEDEIRLYVSEGDTTVTVDDLKATDVFTSSDISGTGSLGVGGVNGGTIIPYSADFLGTVTDNKIYIYETNDITNIYQEV